MKIDWKRKLTSRKFWAAVCGFVSMWIMALWKDASIAQTVTGMIMSAASLIAYMIGEGLADSAGAKTEYPYYPPVIGFSDPDAENAEENYLDYEENEFRKDE